MAYYWLGVDKFDYIMHYAGDRYMAHGIVGVDSSLELPNFAAMWKWQPNSGNHKGRFYCIDKVQLYWKPNENWKNVTWEYTEEYE